MLLVSHNTVNKKSAATKPTPSPPSNIYVLNCAILKVSIVFESRLSSLILLTSWYFLDASCLFGSMQSSFLLIVLLTPGYSVTRLDGWRVCDCEHSCLVHVGVNTCVFVCACVCMCERAFCIVRVFMCAYFCIGKIIKLCSCVRVCVRLCMEQGSCPCRPRPPSLNWKCRLFSQHQGSNQGTVAETKGTLLK